MKKSIDGRSPASDDWHVSTPERLLAAALELFSTLGYHEANLRRIGERAGVDHALVARYFKSKALLFAAAVDRALDAASAASADRRCEALWRVARLMLAAAYAPPDVHQDLVAIVSAKIDTGEGRLDGEPAGIARGLGDAVCQQLAILLLTRGEEKNSAAAALANRLYAHLGRVAPTRLAPGI